MVFESLSSLRVWAPYLVLTAKCHMNVNREVIGLLPHPGLSLKALPHLLHPAVFPVPHPSLTEFCSHD